ncbi:Aste57867_3353 [Aphanomyces stellatus]|uniref:Aste57867_3353 protein n=1 Tax=Aphanomyces stellatus TaxID=120398 RepID=A0A485KDW3_9STRA|nr:hypothetical protein As57867_003343 [Aphanomyces stellatus]VFT80521.1 Aste57867_3353 [Aphanomyces stellatus]
MTLPAGLASRLKAEEAAKKTKASLVKSVTFGIPIAVVLLAFALCFMSNPTSWDLTTDESTGQSEAGWMNDVLEEKRNGDLLFENEHFEPATKYYIKAMKMAKKHAQDKTTTPEESVLMGTYLANSLGMTYVKIGNDTQATTWYQYGLDLDANHLELNYNLGNLLTRAEKWIDAEKHYRKVHRFKPNFPPAMLGLAYVLQKQGINIDESRTLLLDAWEIEKDADIAAQLGWQFMAESDAEKALEWLNVASDMGHVDAANQRNELLAAWLHTQAKMTTTTAGNGHHDGDTIALNEPAL